jgi:NADH dehydrogenase
METGAHRKAPRVVIVGAGFGGLYAAKALGRMPVRVTVVDRKNHHTFQPLLYQVATAGLSPGDIATPVRRILRRYRNTEVVMGEVTGFDLANRHVLLKDWQLPYDYLIVASGAGHSYFAHPEWEPLAPGLKTVEDALEIRRRILNVFEEAERQQLAASLGEDAATANAADHAMNFVIVGAGPTGVELAGAIADIARRILAHDFRLIDPRTARVLLLENAPRVLPSYPEDLSRRAAEQLRKLGVEVRTGALVTAVERNSVWVRDEKIPAALVLWAAGVKASHLGALLGEPLDRAGRVKVQPDLSLAQHREVFVIGDLAALNDEGGHPLPGVAPVAIQMGGFAAQTISRDLKNLPRRNFHYFDKGSLATIGRAAAVADIGRFHFSGLFAWLAWLFIHVLYLIGFRNRVLVILQWAWAYLRFESAARLITDDRWPD